MPTFTLPCEWCQQTFTKEGRVDRPPRFCNRACSAKWRMSRPDYVASLDTPKRRAASSESLRRVRSRPEVQAKLAAHLAGPGNPIRDPAVRAKAATRLRETGYRTLNGGNGQLTVPQKLLAARLGWATEITVPTGRKAPYPHAYKIDIGSSPLMIAIEVDGQSHHSPTARARDAKKDNLLRALGWTVLRFTNRQVLRETESVVATVMEAIGSSTSRQAPGTT